MKLLRSTLDFFQKSLVKPERDMTLLEKWVRFAFDLSRHCTRELNRVRAATMAAALTYHTLFSLLPTLVLALVVMRLFVGEAEQQWFKEQAVNSALSWLSIGEQHSDDELIVDPANKQQPSTQTPDAVSLGRGGREEFERTREALRENIQTYLETLQKINFKSIGVVGVLLFIWGATGLLATIERSFNHIYAVTRPRPWYLRLPMYYTVITLSPLVLIAGRLMQNKFFSLLQTGSVTNWLVGPLVVISPLITSWLVLTVLYMLLPNTRVNRRTAIIGGLVASILWLVGIEAFTLYVQRAAITSLYGALALLPLFLLWLWITWLVVLFGLEITYTLQMMRGGQFEKEANKKTERIVYDPRWVLPVMAAVGRAFVRGKEVTPDAIAHELGLPTTAVAELGELLESEGYVHRIEQGKSESAYSLAKPVDAIALDELIKIGSSHMASTPVQRIHGGVMDRLVEAQHEALSGRTLSELVRGDAD